MGTKIFLNKAITVHACIESESNNNFKLIRLLAACMVVYAHSCGFTNEKSDLLYKASNHAINFSYLGLSVFFFLSGLLVTQSLYYSSSRKNFLWKRFLRIYPAAWLVILSCMFILGPLITILPLKTYFTDPLFYNYAIGLTLIRINYHLPGVFTNAIKQDVNSSLWSITLELKLYIGLLIFYSFKIPYKKIILITAIIVAILIDHFFYDKTENVIKHFNSGFVLYPYVAYVPYFLTGIVFFIYKERIFSNFYIAIISFVLAYLSVKLNCFYVARFLIIPVLVLYFASLKPTLIKKITPKPDLSYGLYVFAFPVQQVISLLTGTNISALEMFLLSVVATLPFAMFSWYFVEKKALSLKRLIK